MKIMNTYIPNIIAIKHIKQQTRELQEKWKYKDVTRPNLGPLALVQ